jgi:hypothetical protein
MLLFIYNTGYLFYVVIYLQYRIFILCCNLSAIQDNLTDIYVGASPNTKLVSGIIQKDISAVNGLSILY